MEKIFMPEQLDEKWFKNQFDFAFEEFENNQLETVEQKMSALTAETRYTGKEFIARGGMKIVSKVYDELVGRVGAMAELQKPDEQIARELFIREAQITAVLQHPNILQIYDFGFNKDENPFFIMKLLKGRNLNVHLKSIDLIKNRTTLLSIFINVCEAVAFAHSKGVMHLDLKPANIWIGDFGETLVMDWGLSRFFESACDEKVLDSQIITVSGATVYGSVRGTPGYMSPEQISKTTLITYKSDIFSLGALLYKMLTGVAPFSGTGVEDIIQKTKQNIWIKPSKRMPSFHIPDSLDAIVSKSLSSNPEDRYTGAGELAADVKSYIEGFATSAENAGVAKQIALLYMRNKRFFNTLFLTGLILIITISSSLNEIRKREKRARDLEKTASVTAKKLEVEKTESVKAKILAANEAVLHGKLLTSQSKFPEAIKSFERAVELGHETDELSYYLSALYISSGELDKSRLFLRKCKKQSLVNSKLYDESDIVLAILNRSFSGKNYSTVNLISFNLALTEEDLKLFVRMSDYYLERVHKMTMKEKKRFVKGKIDIANDREVNMEIKSIKGGFIKLIIRDDKKISLLNSHIQLLPIIEIDARNSAFDFTNDMRFYRRVKVLWATNSKVDALHFFKRAPIEEIYVGEIFKNAFDELLGLRKLKVAYIPRSFTEDVETIELLKRKGVKLVFHED